MLMAMRATRTTHHWPLICLFLLSAACGSTDEATVEEGAGDEASPTGSPSGNAASGMTDPCNIDTGFAGDENCLQPPPAEQGFQIHSGPADYADPEAIEPYVLEGGDEDVVCFNVRPADEDFFYFGQRNHMRPSSHHLILRLIDDTAEEGPAECERGLSGDGLAGSQTPINEIGLEDLAPEDTGLGRHFPAGKLVQFEKHYINTTDEALLREAWVNIYYKDESEIDQTLNGVALVGGLGMNVAPGATEIVAAECEMTGEYRIYSHVGHFHANTARMSAWRVRDGQRDLIYESYNWAEPRTLVFDSVTENGPPDASSGTDGGWDGPLFFEPGDVIQWECEVHNQHDFPIKFANEAYDAEMCILFGAYVGDFGESPIRCLEQ